MGSLHIEFFHNNSPGAERFLGTPRFWKIFDLGTDGNLCRQKGKLIVIFHLTFAENSLIV